MFTGREQSIATTPCAMQRCRLFLPRAISFVVVLLFLSLFVVVNSFYQNSVSTFSRWKTMSSSLQMAQAPFKKPSRHNVEGNFYVDQSCIDCDVCRWMCPSVYTRKGLKSAVTKQPASDDEKLSALAAMIACPVGAIRTYQPEPMTKKALEIFPAEIDPENLPNVYHCGYHATSTFAATSYYIKRPEGSEGGNIMIDAPRYNSNLASIIESEGGIGTLIFTHKDDVVDHKQWKKRFPQMERVMHKADVTVDTADVEVQLQGEGVWFPCRLSSGEADVAIVHTPGHTAGSLCVLYDSAVFREVTYDDADKTTRRKKSERDGEDSSLVTIDLIRERRESVLFTGDHLSYNPKHPDYLDAFPTFNHGSVEKQLESLLLLNDPTLDFHWIMPAHGRMKRFASIEEKRSAIAKAAEIFSCQTQNDNQEEQRLGDFFRMRH